MRAGSSRRLRSGLCVALMLALGLARPGQATMVAIAAGVQFGTATQYGGSNLPWSDVTSGYIDTDANLDLVASAQNKPLVTVLTGGSTGKFTVGNGNQTQGGGNTALGDFNQDGKTDIAAAGSSNTVTVLFNDGSGGFQSSASFGAGTTTNSSITSGDFNGDGKLDIAVANPGTGGNVGILLNAGNGAFQNVVTTSVGTQLSSMAAGDFNGDGKLDLAVTDQNANTVDILLGTGTGKFGTPVTYSVGASPSSVAVGDFNGDNKLDLAVANGSSNSVSVLLGNGDGTFQSAVSYTVGTGPVAIATGDFDKDGKLDLAVANNGSSTLSILVGNGDGTFQGAVTVGLNGSIQGSFPTSMVVGDFNNDGLPDLALTDSNPAKTSYFVAVLLNATSTAPILKVTKTVDNATITAGQGAGYTIQVSNTGAGTASSVTLNDPLPGSGATGWVIDPNTGQPGGCGVTGSAPSQQLTCTFGDLAVGASASVHITSPTDYTGCPSQAQSYPLTNMASASAANASAASGDATTTVTCPIPTANPDSYTASENTALTVSAASGVLSNDTAPSNDPLTAQVAGKPSNGTLSLSSDGSFTYTPNFGSCGGQDTFTYDAVDATTQLVSTPATVSIQVNCPAAISIQFGNPVQEGGVGTPWDSLVTGSIDNDTNLDLAASASGHGQLTVFNGSSTGSFTQSSTTYQTSNGGFAASADFNHDGHTDLALTTATGQVSILINDASGGFAKPATYGAGTGSQSAITTGDFNGDGKTDVAVANPGSSNGSVAVLLGVGDGTLSSSATIPVGTQLSAIAAGDFNGDGKLDIAVADKGSNTVDILVGDGTGKFQTSKSYAVGKLPTSVAVGDFNGDNKLDLAVANGNSNSVSVLLGNGDGTFQPALAYTVGTGPVAMAMADFNNDGKLDLAVADNSAGTVSILPGNGDGSFQTVQTVSLTGPGTIQQSLPTSIVVGDFNRDGLPDLALTDSNPAQTTYFLTVLLNTTATSTAPGLNMTKSADSTTISAGQQAGYTIRVTSNGSATATGVTLSDPLPGAGGTSWSIDQPYAGPGTCSIGGTVGSQTLSCAFGDLAAGMKASIHIASATDTSDCQGGASYSLLNSASAAAGNVTAVSASAGITVTCPSQPVANPDSYTTAENVSLTVPPPGVLQNDTPSSPSDPMQALIQTQPSSGTLTPDGNKDGGFTYTPASGFCGTDSFKYQALDTATNLTSAPTTVTIQVSCIAILQIKKVADTPTISPGGSASYTITITNVGSAPAGNVSLTDALPGAGFSINWQTDQGSQCTVKGDPGNGEFLNCTNLLANGLGVGQQVSIHVFTQGVPSSYCGVSNTLSNTASVTWSTPNAGSNSSTAVIQVNCQVTPSLTTQASPSSVTLDATGSPTLTDMATLSGGNSPTGSIAFTLMNPGNVAVDVETVPVTGNGTYTTPTGYALPTSGHVTGIYTWVVAYSGDSSNTSAGSQGESVKVIPATPTLTTLANPAQVTLGSGQPLNDKADLEGAYFPTGPINFTLTDGNGVVVYQDTVTVSGNGGASTQGQGTNPGGFLPTSPGTYTWKAVFPGNANNNPIQAAFEPVTVNASSTTTTITSSVNPSVFGQTVTFKAAVTSGGGTPTGQVNFTDGSVLLGTVSLDMAGTAVLSTASLSAGSHTITASYTGSGGSNPSSAGLTQKVNQASTTTKVAPSANPSILDQPVTFTATVVVSGPGAGTPTGTVTFKDGTTILGTGTLGANGNPANVATFSTSTLAIGTHSITAVYGGDGSFVGSTSSSSSQQVSFNVKVLTTSIAKNAPTIYLQLWDFNFTQNVSPQKPKVTAVCVVPFSSAAPSPTTCANAIQTSAANAGTFSYLSDYNGQGPSFWYKVSTKGLTPGAQYYQLVQTDGDPLLHAILFSD